jgi:pimeloyl-ACP methyl ester carboxylesterase
MKEVRWRTADGLVLFAIDNFLESDLTPLLCLPGLTRNSKDFAPIFALFGQERRIIAIDFRGRGKSQYAADPISYRPDVELMDTIGLLDFLNVPRVGVVGTSRGGIVGMLMATLNPQRIAGLFLNDIGPTLETEGLLRIASYVGKTPSFATWAEAAEALKVTSIGFEKVSDAAWLAFAKRVLVLRDNRLYTDYDPRLMATFPKHHDILAGKVADLWPLMPGLAKMPIAVLRGSNSDLLSHKTVLAMGKQLKQMLSAEVPERGHAPFLDEPASVELLAAWCAELEKSEFKQKY